MAVLALPVVRGLPVVGLVVLLLIACGAESNTPPTADPQGALSAAPSPRPSTPSPHAPTPSPLALAPTSAPPLEPTAAAAATYRAWMEEARRLHPYDEAVDVMWAVMICESSGDAGIVAAGHHGLFQYSLDTWSGAWNPYRDQSILDPRAQIFATAKAWQDGNQSWWGCSQ